MRAFPRRSCWMILHLCSAGKTVIESGHTDSVPEEDIRVARPSSSLEPNAVPTADEKRQHRAARMDHNTRTPQRSKDFARIRRGGHTLVVPGRKIGNVGANCRNSQQSRASPGSQAHTRAGNRNLEFPSRCHIQRSRLPTGGSAPMTSAITSGPVVLPPVRLTQQVRTGRLAVALNQNHCYFGRICRRHASTK